METQPNQQPNISITNAQPQSGDHDLLLTLKAEVTTKLDRVISDVKDLKDDTVARIGALEQEKLNRTVFETYKAQATKDFEEYKKTTDSTIVDLTKTARSLQNWLYYGLGFCAAIEAGLVIYQIFKS